MDEVQALPRAFLANPVVLLQLCALPAILMMPGRPHIVRVWRDEAHTLARILGQADGVIMAAPRAGSS